MWICDPTTSEGKWELEETVGKPVSLLICLCSGEQEKTVSNKVEGEDQCLRLFFDLHVHALAHTCRHAHMSYMHIHYTHACTHNTYAHREKKQ